MVEPIDISIGIPGEEIDVGLNGVAFVGQVGHIGLLVDASS